MKALKNLFRKLFSISFLKKHIPRILLACALIAIILFGVHACSSGTLLKKQVYVIGRDSSFYPLQMLGRERNLLAFSNDLINAISQESELKFAWLDANPGSLFDTLDSGTCDLILSSGRPNNYNQEKYVFSELVFKTGAVLILPQNSSINSLKQMEGLTLGIPYGTVTTFNSVRKSGLNIYNLIFVTFFDINKAADALTKNQIDGIIMGSIPAYTFLKGIYGGTLKIASNPLSDEGMRFVGLKDAQSEMLISNINNAMRTIKKNGIYQTLIDKWNLFDPDKNFSQ